MYEEFIKETSKFIFAENKPEKADIIFVPGNGYSQMAERAAQLYAKKYAPFVQFFGNFNDGFFITDFHRYFHTPSTQIHFLFFRCHC